MGRLELGRSSSTTTFFYERLLGRQKRTIRPTSRYPSPIPRQIEIHVVRRRAERPSKLPKRARSDRLSDEQAQREGDHRAPDPDRILGRRFVEQSRLRSGRVQQRSDRRKPDSPSGVENGSEDRQFPGPAVSSVFGRRRKPGLRISVLGPGKQGGQEIGQLGGEEEKGAEESELVVVEPENEDSVFHSHRT